MGASAKSSHPRGARNSAWKGPAVCALIITTGIAGLAGSSPLGKASTTVALPEVDPHLEAQLTRGGALTLFIHAGSADKASAAARRAGLQVVEEWSGIGVSVAHGPVAGIRALAADVEVRYLESPPPVILATESAYTASRVAHARSPEAGLLRDDDLPFDGEGITIAINDSGIESTHPMFVGSERKVLRNLRQRCPAVVSQSDPCSEWIEASNTDIAYGHGTLVASIAAGYERRTTEGRPVRGAAPGAGLVGLSWGSQREWQFHAVSGLNWVLENHADPCGDGSCPPIRIVNNSWYYAPDFEPELSAARALMERLVEEGVVVVNAAGNEGGDGSQTTINPLAHLPIPGVIGVANYDDANTGTAHNRVHPSSSRGKISDVSTYPDVSAPGSEITAACSTTSTFCRTADYKQPIDAQYGTALGTSQAAPHVAGVVALLLEADPTLSPAEVEDILEDTARPFGTSPYVTDPDNANHTTSFDGGHGLIDAAAALGHVLSRPVEPAIVCSPGVFVDEPGDATDLAQPLSLPPAASTAALDVLETRVRTDGRRDMITEIRVADLGGLPPPGAIGEIFQLAFRYRGAGYELHLERIAGQLERFSLQTGGNIATRQMVADGLEGSFDVPADTIRVVVPNDAFNSWNPALPAISSGDAFFEFEVQSARSVGTAPAGPLSVTADLAQGNCVYVVA